MPSAHNDGKRTQVEITGIRQPHLITVTQNTAKLHSGPIEGSLEPEAFFFLQINLVTFYLCKEKSGLKGSRLSAMCIYASGHWAT